MARPAAMTAMTAQELRDMKALHQLTTRDLMLAFCISRRMVYFLLAGRHPVHEQHAHNLRLYLTRH